MTEPLDLKKTVNLPKTDFAQKANLGQSEPARLKKWKEMGLYEKVIEARKAAKSSFSTTARRMRTPTFTSARRLIRSSRTLSSKRVR